MFLRSFIDQIIYEKQKDADIEKALSSCYCRKSTHDIRFKYGSLQYVKNVHSGMNEERRLINELILLSYFEETK